MNIGIQIILGFSMSLLILSSIFVIAIKKPLKLWGISLCFTGFLLLFFSPEQRYLACGMVSVAALYFAKTMRIFAHRRKNVLLNRKSGTSFFADIFGRLMSVTKMEWLERIISLAGAVFFVTMFFPFRKFAGNDFAYLKYTAFVIFITYYVFELFHVVLQYIVAPLFVIGEETRTARLSDALMLERYIGRGIMVEEPYLFFEKEECYVSYKSYSKAIGDIAGYVCEYTVYTDLFGNEFIGKCPAVISADREFMEIVSAEELRTGMGYYGIGRRLQYLDVSNKSALPILLGFILPVILISLTMLLLYLFFK